MNYVYICSQKMISISLFWKIYRFYTESVEDIQECDSLNIERKKGHLQKRQRRTQTQKKNRFIQHSIPFFLCAIFPFSLWAAHIRIYSERVMTSQEYIGTYTQQSNYALYVRAKDDKEKMLWLFLNRIAQFSLWVLQKPFKLITTTTFNNDNGRMSRLSRNNEYLLRNGCVACALFVVYVLLKIVVTLNKRGRFS